MTATTPATPSDPTLDAGRLVAVVDELVAAWLAGDLDRTMACCAADVVYCPSGAGALPIFRGQDEVRAAFAERIGPDDQISLQPVQVIGPAAAVHEWSYPPADDGTVFRGLDLYAFEGGLVVRKDVFAKLVGGSRVPADDRDEAATTER